MKTKLKVLICVFACIKDPDDEFSSSAGGETVLGWNIIIQLSRFFEISALTDIGNKNLIEEKLADGSLSGVDFYYIGLPKFLNFTKKWIQIYAYIWQIKAYFVARKLNKEKKFDVFHHVTYANDWMASFMGAFLPIPYMRGPGGGAHRVPKKFVREYSFKQRVTENIRSIGQWIFRHDPIFIIGQNKAKAILVCNKESFDALSESWQKKAYFFPVNGLAPEDLLALDKGLSNENDAFSVLSAGKLIKIKGFDLAIRAFKIFSEKAYNAKFTIVGDGPELKKIENLIYDLNIKDRVVLEKWMPREKLFEKMAGCDVFLFASLRDGGGNVVVEAMAAGKPVICFDIAGPGFHIDEKCGIKIRPDSPEQSIKDMASALAKLYSNKELRVKLGAGARKKAEKEYDWDKLGNRLNEIYKKVL
ncbi:MAG: glycosyltransferase [Candidatus Staskawiczbacteria bacterium]|nr:glycosyltransferase [Candidatus Staskawiczbacteria bacterium]